MMKLSLRNQLADWCLAALADPAHEAPIRALGAFARAADGDGVAYGLADGDAGLLAASELFEQRETAVGLRADLRADLAALRRRAGQFTAALAACRATCGIPAERARDVPWALCAAAALYNAGLFFEVHELLEDSWRPVEGELKPFLQGLIQVAVGFHHHGNGNLRGAIALLAEGVAKLEPFAPEAHGVELAEFCRAVAAIVATLRGPHPPAELAVPPLVVRQRSAIKR